MLSVGSGDLCVTFIVGSSLLAKVQLGCGEGRDVDNEGDYVCVGQGDWGNFCTFFSVFL